MAAWAAATLLLRRATIWNFDLPVGVRKEGRWAVDAHDVTAEAERPIIAVRTGIAVVRLCEYLVRYVQVCSCV